MLIYFVIINADCLYIHKIPVTGKKRGKKIYKDFFQMMCVPKTDDSIVFCTWTQLICEENCKSQYREVLRQQDS